MRAGERGRKVISARTVSIFLAGAETTPSFVRSVRVACEQRSVAQRSECELARILKAFFRGPVLRAFAVGPSSFRVCVETFLPMLCATFLHQTMIHGRQKMSLNEGANPDEVALQVEKVRYFHHISYFIPGDAHVSFPPFSSTCSHCRSFCPVQSSASRVHESVARSPRGPCHKRF